MTKELGSTEKDQTENIYDLMPGAVIELDAEDMNICLSPILKYDPQASGIRTVTRSMNALHLVDVLLDDGALWQLHQHPIGLLIPTLKVLGSSHQGKPLTANIASVYCPIMDVSSPLDINRVSIPEVDCGEGYQQLGFNEEIRETDEWYAGPEDGWKKCSVHGSYWPSHSSAGGPYALMRRASPTVRKVA